MQPVAIVGGGPAALVLALILEGYIPFYDNGTFGPHPDTGLDRLLQHHQDLLSALQNSDVLEYARNNLETFYSPDVQPSGLLIDTLNAADETNFVRDAMMQRRIVFRHEPERKIPYCIISDNAPGGQWSCNKYDCKETKSLSYAEQLSLPLYSFSAFYLQTKGEVPPDFYRPSREEVSEYYGAFRDKFELNMIRDRVQSIEGSGDSGFILHLTSGAVFDAKDVVLASGITTCQGTELVKNVSLGEGVSVVVGSGASAADVLLETKGPRVHIYRWLDTKGSPSALRKFSNTAYPSYREIFEYMRSRKGPDYIGYPNAEVLKLDPENSIISLKLEDGSIVEVKTKTLYVRNGREGSLVYASALLPYKSDSWCSIRQKTLENSFPELPCLGKHIWAIGSLCGNSLVRFLLGMSYQVAGAIEVSRKSN